MAAAALLAAAISGVTGMGGGTLLLAVMFSFLPHGSAIPIHGVVQLASNSTRVAAFWKDCDRYAVEWFTVGAVPGAAVGALLLWRLGKMEASEPYLKLLVGVYVLTAALLPSRSGNARHSPTAMAGAPTQEGGAAEAAGRRRGFGTLGVVAGVMCLTVGAVGPLLGPIFARRDYVKERLIATKASCQLVTHVIKLPVFVALGTFDLGALWRIALPLILVSIPGTLLGKYLLRFVSPRLFRWIYQVSLVASGAKLIAVDGVAKLW